MPRLPNNEVIQQLKEAVAAMEVKNYNYFRVRAYQDAISVLDNLTVSIYDLWESKRLQQIPGIGAGLAAHLKELFEKGEVEEFNELKEDLPDGMFELIYLRGIGAKRAFQLASAFNLNDRDTVLEDLKEHAEAGEIRDLEGFGEKSEASILENIENNNLSKNEKERMLFIHAEQVVDRIVSYMKESEYVLKIEAAGSFRRKNPTIGDLDFPVSTNNPEEVIKHFLDFREIKEVIVEGDKKVSVELTNDVQVDIRTVEPEAYGSMLQYFTGSKQHNIVLRNYALEKNLSLSEYGIKKDGEIIKTPTEKEFYDYLGLPYISPELRHGLDEVDLAKKNKLPSLIKIEDIKGDVHMHSTYSDGVNTINEMAAAVKNKGYEYMAITDHSPSMQTHSENEIQNILDKTRKEIEKVEKELDIKIFYGYEVHILSDATLALSDKFLKQLDFGIAGIHTSFDQDREQITKRLVNAINNPYINIIAHPSGRILNERDPVDPDWKKVFQAARDTNTVLEISAQPDRLDLPDDLVKEAIEWGIRFIINTDSHQIDQLDYMKYGLNVARRGGAEPINIINTYDLKSFVETLDIR